MDFDDYQRLAMRTKNPDLDPKLAKAIAALGLAGEAGETADYIKKVVGHAHEIDPAHLAKEIGDVLWYCASLCDEFGLSLEEVAEMNIEKLRRRYPAGFSSADSIERRDLTIKKESSKCSECGGTGYTAGLALDEWNLDPCPVCQ